MLERLEPDSSLPQEPSYGAYGKIKIEEFMTIRLLLLMFFWDFVQFNTSWWCHSHSKFFCNSPLPMIILDWKAVFK